MPALHSSWLLLLLLQVTSYGAADVFTSSEKMSDLAALEKAVMDAVSERIRADTLLLEQRYTQLTAGDLDDDVINHPNGAYLIVKSFLYSWQNVINTYPDFSELDDYHRALVPTADDLQGALSAILRLQRVYDLPVHEMYAGNYSGYLGPPLNPLDAFNIGRQGFVDGLLDLSIAWLELSLQKGRLTIDNETESDRKETDDSRDWMDKEEIVATLGLLGRVNLYAGNAQKAKELYKESMSVDPSASGDVTELGKELEEFADKPPPAFPREQWHRNLSELCSRPKQLTVTDIRPYHVCRYKPGSAAPAYVRYREEIVSSSPYVSLFYDVISDSEIEAVKQFAKGKIQRAGVEDKANGRVLSLSRIGENCWIGDDDMLLAAKLSLRVTDITGLDTNKRLPDGPSSAESLQVVNYGLGGHYNAHFDPVKQTPPATELQQSGARIATFLFYLSDVEKGGHTVFVDAGISVAPVKGMALFWYNYSPAMELEKLTLHAGCPVLKGHKWIANKWIWTYGNTFRRPCGPRPQSTQLDVEDLTPRLVSATFDAPKRGVKSRADLSQG